MWLEWLKAMLRYENARKPIKILWVIDFENLLISVKEELSPENYSLEAGFERFIQVLTEEIGGEIILIFAFIPTNSALIWGNRIHRLGFNIQLCPKVRDKKGIEQDTVDAKLIELTEQLLDLDSLHQITHLCLGAGDKDYSALLKRVKRKGRKRIILAGNLNSLATEIIELADRKPDGGRMIYLFSPFAATQKI